MKLSLQSLTSILIIIVLSAAGCGEGGSDTAHNDGHGSAGEHGGDDHHDHGHGVEAARGPMGGRLFLADDLQLELRIEEEEGPPVFLAYLYDGDGVRLSPDGAKLRVTLGRFANRTDVISFSAVGNHLRGDRVVSEPHSFKASIELGYNNRQHEFAFEQHEFRVELSMAAVERANIVAQPAGPGHIDVSVESPGEVRLNSERMLIVSAMHGAPHAAPSTAGRPNPSSSEGNTTATAAL